MWRLRWAICGSVVFVGALLAARLVSGDEVVDNAVVAHKRLVRLFNALQIYLNDDPHQQFDDPIRLYPVLVSDPLVFWHPGDNDPAPSTIDNSAPNAPNSAQISYLFRTGGLLNLHPDDYVIWDASPANNEGRFISGITASGLVETIPPSQVPVPTKITVARHRLCGIGKSLHAYLNDYEGWLPSDLSVLYRYEHFAPRSFWNPGDSDPMPTAITNTVPNAPNSANISFDFPAAGLHIDQLAPNDVMLQDNTPANNAGMGISIYRASGVCEFQLVGLPGDANGDQRIDLADWAKLQRCFQEWEYLEWIEDDACRVFDFNSDDRITAVDHQQFVGVMKASIRF